VRYLHDKYGSRLIPKDLQKRARTDVAMDNYHNNLRIGAARTFWFGFMAPNIGMKVDPALQKDAHGILRSSLKTLDATLSSQKYLARDEITFVDMLVYSEIRQLDLVDYDLSPFTSLVAWMGLMTKVPHHDEVFDVLVKLKEASDKRKAAAKAKQEGAKL
jgi:glutathione S-transferase